MKQNWKGRYGEVVAAIVRFNNIAARNSTLQIDYTDYGFSLSAQEWQVLEYLLEHPDSYSPMAHISQDLGIATSTLTKYSSKLAKLGLVEKYKAADNRKNIILRASRLGEQFYEQMVDRFMKANFQGFFQALSSLDDKQLAKLTEGIESLAGRLDTEAPGGSHLIRLD